MQEDSNKLHQLNNKLMAMTFFIYIIDNIDIIDNVDIIRNNNYTYNLSVNLLKYIISARCILIIQLNMIIL